VMTLSLTNAHVRLPAEVEVVLRGGALREVTSHVLSHEDLRAHNTFDSPGTLAPVRASIGWGAGPEAWGGVGERVHDFG
jgi:alpha-L-arabinofuranosidase